MLSSVQYDETAGVFTISGPGTPEQYEILLRDLTYFNKYIIIIIFNYI